MAVKIQKLIGLKPIGNYKKKKQINLKTIQLVMVYKTTNSTEKLVIKMNMTTFTLEEFLVSIFLKPML